MSDFKKVSELTGSDRTKLKKYWGELWGKDFANALVTDFKPQGETKKVSAKSKKSVR